VHWLRVRRDKDRLTLIEPLVVIAIIATWQACLAGPESRQAKAKTVQCGTNLAQPRL
jgi:hypothetical protein